MGAASAHFIPLTFVGRPHLIAVIARSLTATFGSFDRRSHGDADFPGAWRADPSAQGYGLGSGEGSLRCVHKKGKPAKWMVPIWFPLNHPNKGTLKKGHIPHFLGKEHRAKKVRLQVESWH